MMRPTRSKTGLEAAGLSRRDRAFQRESVNEQGERAKKTACLRAFRLAKEVAEKTAAKAKVPAKKTRLIKHRQATENCAAAISDADLAGVLM